MIEVKDEVLSGEARFRVRDNNGNIIFDNLTIEQITPVTQEGTPINKELFERLQSDTGLIQHYNTPKITKRWDNYNYLALTNKSDKYIAGMRIFLQIEQEFEEFNESIIPTLTGNSKENAINGFYTGQYEAFDRDENTYTTKTMVYSKIICPIYIKPTEIRATVQCVNGWGRTFRVYGVNDDNIDLPNSTATDTPGTELSSGVTFNDENIHTHTFLIEKSDYYKNFFIRQFPGGKDGNIYSMEIIKGEIGKYNPSVYSYININNLGNKLINGLMKIGKKYELVYDGTMFSAREVV